MLASSYRRALLAAGVSLGALIGAGGAAWAQDSGNAVEELIVTAQKKEERIQDVPIAISAFSQEALDARKIDGGFDLLRAVPNVTFSKSNYSGYNFSIRGVGTKAVSATSDPGVAVAFNNTTLLRNRLFEQEYLDVERVEVLRGPQGTLFGRNATAGVVNVITARPQLETFDGEVEIEVGSYTTRRGSGMLNVPLGDTLALRLAGAFTERDGYGYNLTTQQDVDSRHLWSTRLSLAWEPTDRLRADFIWERFEEDDSRLRTGKQLCHHDAGPETLPGVVGPIDPLLRGRLSTGCKPGSLYDKDAYGVPNGISIPFVFAGMTIATLGYTEPLYYMDPAFPWGPSWNAAAAPIPVIQYGLDPYGNLQQSRDLRTIESNLQPRYEAKADIFSLNVSYDLTDSLTLTSQTLYNEDKVWSFQDYNRFRTLPLWNDPAGLYEIFPDSFDPSTWNDPTRLAGLTPGGVFCDPQIGCSDSIAGFEISSSESEQFSQEFRLESSFDGPFNFTVGANYMKVEGLNDYYLFFNAVTILAMSVYNLTDTYGCGLIFGQPSSTCMYVDPNPVDELDGKGHNYFRNQNPFKTESRAIFGEAYWSPSDTLKLTFGLRYTDDEKTFTPWRSQLLQNGYEYGPDPDINQDWQEFTGRLGFDWKPELGFTDETMLYGFYSRGYKGGGANPPRAAGMPVAVENPITFDPEYVDAFEIGAKNTLLGGSMTLNLSAFYYDYKDYQVSKVVDRTVVNENFDAQVWGLELESVWRPVENLTLFANLGLLNTKIGDGESSIDIFNRTQGNPDWIVSTPFIQQTSNCIYPREIAGRFAAMGLFPGAAGIASPIVLACLNYLNPGAWAAYGFDPADHPEINNGAGFAADLSGNELPNAPHWTLSIGGEYRWRLASGWEVIARGDYYRQGDSYARVYNTVADRLKGWDNANLSLVVAKPADALTFEVYAKNIFDKTPITDAFLNSDSTGMTTNVFTLDPRIIGVSVRKGF